MSEFILQPDPTDPRLTRRVAGVDQEGRPIETSVVVERPLTLFLNKQEIVTMMTIGDYPDYLAVGYLINQNMLHRSEEHTSELQSLMRISYAVFCLKKKNKNTLINKLHRPVIITTDHNNQISCYNNN